MNAKTTQKYELIASLVKGEGIMINNLSQLCAIDFTTAFEMWEFVLARGASADLIPSGLVLFLNASETKTKTLFVESLPLQKIIYSSSTAMDPIVVTFLVNFIIAAKIDVADECLTRIRGNQNIEPNDALRVIVEQTFTASCVKNNSKVAVLNKKQKDLFMSHINKIKGPNKALLLQRMKEL